jgi:hypothetical protein
MTAALLHCLPLHLTATPTLASSAPALINLASPLTASSALSLAPLKWYSTMAALMLTSALKVTPTQIYLRLMPADQVQVANLNGGPLAGMRNRIINGNFGGAEGTNPTLIANATYENTPANLSVTTSYATYSLTASVDTASTTNIIVFIWSDVTDTTAGDFLYVTDVQLEPGPVATPFEQRPIGTELSLCQRYFQKNNGTASRALFQGYCVNGQGYPSRTPFHQQMRVAPTVSLTHADSLGFPGTAGSTSADASAFVESRTANSTPGPPPPNCNQPCIN